MIFAEVTISSDAMAIVGTVFGGALLAIFGAGILMFVRMGKMEAKLEVLDERSREDVADRVTRQRDHDTELSAIYGRLNHAEQTIAGLQATVTAFNSTVNALNAAVNALTRVLDRIDRQA